MSSTKTQILISTKLAHEPYKEFCKNEIGMHIYLALSDEAYMLVRQFDVMLGKYRNAKRKTSSFKHD